MLRCIFCGYCEEACPVQAIVLGPEYELSDTSREKFIYTKEKLLEPLPPDVQARIGGASAGGPGATGDTLGHAPTQMDAKEKKELAVAVFFVAAARAVIGAV